MTRKLAALLREIADTKTYGEIKISIKGICDNSKQVKKGDLFVAIKGYTVDSHKFIDEAIGKGVAAVVGEIEPKKKWLKEIAYVKVDNSREALGILASSWYANPSGKLNVIGVTGTDGKTTTATLIFHILKSAGKKVGLITTLSAKIGNQEYDTGFHVTNPEPLELQKFLGKMVEESCEYAVLEVTSHSLSQERVAGVQFDTAVLTNITHEHLDYHSTFEEYRATKALLFNRVKWAVLNKDDDSYTYISNNLRRKTKSISYGFESNANVSAKNVRSLVDKSEFDILFKDQVIKVVVGLIGSYNISNVLAAVVVTKIYKITNKDIIRALKTFKGIEGRLEEVKNNKGIRIVIDFAHTPNSLASVLRLLSEQTKGRLIAVFGCAGERDIEKRKLMPKISVKHADISVFTAEDPRSENVNDIIKVMEKSVESEGAYKLGTKKSKRTYTTIAERGEAISMAINKLARKGDVVVILGKGHEKSMAYGKVEYPWSDHEAVQMALKGKVKKINYR